MSPTIYDGGREGPARGRPTASTSASSGRVRRAVAFLDRIATGHYVDGPAQRLLSRPLNGRGFRRS